jgi:putative tricarboxylic transport membrane protein
VSDDSAGRPALRHKAAEIGMSALFLAIGLLVIFESVRLGIGWEEPYGPRPGYFPFYVGLIMSVSALVNAVRALIVYRAANKTFVEVGQLKLVLAVLVPTTIYAGLVIWLGIFLSSALFIAFFMRWLGKYPWWKVALVSVGAVIVFYLIFDTWFKVPLPKGPLEAFLGIA